LLLLRAGSGPSDSLSRSLKSGDPSLYIVGCHDDPFVLAKSLADRNYLTPASPPRVRLRALQRIVKTERIDLVIPTTDDDVLMIAHMREKLPCRVFLPRTSVIERCQDKYALATFLRRRGIPAPLTFAIASLKEIESVFRRLAPRPLLWCRVRKGSGSFAAIPVKRPEQVRSWISYWQEMRDVPEGAFTLSEYLPGRDFCVQSLWRNGTPVLAKMAERISYIDTGSPSGVSSMASLAKTVFEPRAVKACAKAIRALDPKASGAFFIDMKENESGTACITEINAGRFASMTNLHDLTGQHNMASIYVRLGMGEYVKLSNPYDFAEDYYIVRSVDTIPAVIQADRLFEGMEDATD
jgi:carbamoyl-phosphate synthase large subunit